MQIADKLSKESKARMVKFYERRTNNAGNFAESLYYWNRLKNFEEQLRQEAEKKIINNK